MQNEDLLLDLIEHILHVGLEWYLYSQLKTNYFYRCVLTLMYTKDIYIFSKSIFSSLIKKFLFLFIKSIGFSRCNVNCKQNHKNKILFLDALINPFDTCNSYKEISIIMNQDSIKYLFYQIRQLIYHKNRIGYWRINNHLTYSQAINKIRQIMVEWYTYYSLLLDLKQLSDINVSISSIVYCWKSKKI